jgi:dTDP-glucose pyrophosphorylase
MVTEHKNYTPFIVRGTGSVKECMSKIEANKKGAVLVTDEANKLIGTVSDGDIRRGILNGVGLQDPVSRIMNTSPITLPVFNYEEAERIFLDKKISLIPVVNNEKVISSVLVFTLTVAAATVDNPVVLMVGGEGSRLAPLTNDMPKPLLKVGDKPILQIILERLSMLGFRNIFLCTRYKAEEIEKFCGDGSRFNLAIQYYREEQKLGTAGAVAFLEDKLTLPFILMNGDLLTALNYRHILSYHLDNVSDLTVGSKDYTYSVPFGVLDTDGIAIRQILEKPTYTYRVSAGIYVISPQWISRIPKGSYFDITDLMATVLKEKGKLNAFPIEEYWLDIGQHQDYKQANIDFYNYFTTKNE